MSYGLPTTVPFQGLPRSADHASQPIAPRLPLVSVQSVARKWQSGEGRTCLQLAQHFAGPLAASLVLAASAVAPSSALMELSAPLPPIPTEFPELGDLRLPDIEKFSLSNGLRVFLVEDHDVPLVKASLLFRGGLRTSPADKVGLATIAAAVQRAGGSTAHPGTKLDEALEQRAAFIEGGAGPEASSIGFECLAEDVGEVMGLFVEVLRAPALPQEKVDLYKSQVLNLLEHMNDSASQVPRRQLSKLLYGKDSVYARSPTPDQVRRLTRGDIVAQLAAWQRPDLAVLGVAGDFDACALKALLEQQLGPWVVGPSQPKQAPSVPSTPLPEFIPGADTVFLVDRPGLTQAAVAVGELGIQLGDPDGYALDVLGDILNSFGGRLFDRIRSREGLAYSVSGGFDTPIDHLGLFTAGGETAAPSAFLTQLQRVLKEATVTAPTDEEVARAQSETLNSFVFNFASTNAQMQRVLIYALLGLPDDYLFTYKAGIESVTAQDILAAAQRHLHPDQQTVVMAADADVFTRQLEEGSRRVLPMTVD